MKNPLHKRLPRELRYEFGKYLVIFVFVAGIISLVSGFLVADDSLIKAYDESFEKYNIEDGNFALSDEADDTLINELEKEDIDVFNNFYKEEDTKEVESTLRIFAERNKVDKVCLMEGEMPATMKQIAVDRMYADNNKLNIGDILTIDGNVFCISGLVAFSDYSALFSDNADLMFDASQFGVAIMTKEGWNTISDTHLTYNYSWKYNDKPVDDTEEKEISDDFLKVLTTQAAMNQLTVEHYIPQYLNQAIHFTGDDMGGDKNMITAFLYIVILIIAFVFAVTTSNTIVKEASVIGTLRASGYTKGELIRHYLAMPVIVTLISALVGNVIGYTLLKGFFADLYYGSYSLPTYVTVFNSDAFIKTTIIPILIMLIVNLVILVHKIQLSPLKFLRHDLKKNARKKAFRLNTKIPIFSRFRMRIIFQNIPNYIVVFIGVVFANFILLFGLFFTPMLEHYEDVVLDNMICDYEYVLKAPVETDNTQAEKFILSSVNTQEGKMKVEEVSVYGIDMQSNYVDINFSDSSDGEVYISNAYANKRNISVGDTITLDQKYGDDIYTFKVGGIYEYPSALAIYMPLEEYRNTFDKDDDYFNGYFSNEKLTDIDEKMIATTVTKSDLTKVTRQLEISMGDMMGMVTVLGIIMFMLLIYLLSKQIIEKNAQSISMVKILGYRNGEINLLYILSTTLVVVLSSLISLPIINGSMRELMKVVLADYPGWLEYYCPTNLLAKIFIMGIIAYAVVAIMQMIRISKIPKSDALKNVE